MSEPAFVYGAMRSGTTVFRLMLDAHGALSNPGEVDFLFDHIHPTGDGGWRYDIDALRADRIYQSKRLTLPPDCDGEALMRALVAQLAARGGDVPLTLNIHRRPETVARFFPGAAFIHMLRDPRDVARSSIGMGWAADLYHGVDDWIAVETAWDAATALIPPERRMELRYEALFTDVEAELKRVTAFLGAPYAASMLDYHRTSTYGPPDPKLIEQWRRKSSAKEIGRLEGKAGALMIQRGYALSGHPVLRPAGLRLLALKLRNKVLRYRFAVRRFGVGLLLMEKLTRRLGLISAHQRYRARMNAIVTARLK